MLPRFGKIRTSRAARGVALAAGCAFVLFRPIPFAVFARNLSERVIVPTATPGHQRPFMLHTVRRVAWRLRMTARLLYFYKSMLLPDEQALGDGLRR